MYLQEAKMKMRFFCKIMILIVIAACVAIGFRATPAAAQIISSGPLDFEERLIINNVGGYIYGIGAADLDGDGDLDLTSADSIYDELMWYENDGQGNLTQRLIGNFPGASVRATLNFLVYYINPNRRND